MALFMKCPSHGKGSVNDSRAYTAMLSRQIIRYYLTFWFTVKAVPHEWVIRAGQP